MTDRATLFRAPDPTPTLPEEAPGGSSVTLPSLSLLFLVDLQEGDCVGSQDQEGARLAMSKHLYDVDSDGGEGL